MDNFQELKTKTDQILQQEAAHWKQKYAELEHLIRASRQSSANDPASVRSNFMVTITTRAFVV